MSDPLDPVMRACVVCGRWMALSKESQRVYCCEDCSSSYETCQNCGNFFLKGSGPGGKFCSEECREGLPHHFSHFKELDE